MGEFIIRTPTLIPLRNSNNKGLLTRIGNLDNTVSSPDQNDQCLLSQVSHLIREDLAHPALWVFLIAIAPGNQVNMRMKYRLPRTLACIHPDIESGNFAVLCLQARLRTMH